MRIQKYFLIIILLIISPLVFPESLIEVSLDPLNNMNLSRPLNGSSSWIINWDNYSWTIKAVVSDPSENIYCAGIVDPNPPEYYGPPEVNSIFISKFNSSGIEEWTLEFDYNYPYLGLVIGSDNNIYTFWEINYGESLLLKVDSSGNLLWNFTFRGVLYDFRVDIYKNLYFWEYDIFDNILGLIKLNESGDMQYNYTFSVNYLLCVRVDELNNTFFASYTHPYINLHKVNSSGELILVKQFDKPPNLGYFFFDNWGNLYSVAVDNSYSNIIFKYNRSGDIMFNTTWKSFNPFVYQSFWSQIDFDTSRNVYCSGVTRYYTLIERSEIFLNIFNENGTLLGSYHWRKYHDTSLGSLHIDHQDNLYLSGYSEKGRFLVKNPVLEDYSISIFHFYIDEEALSTLVTVSIIFGVWSLLGISLYIYFFKKKTS